MSAHEEEQSELFKRLYGDKDYGEGETSHHANPITYKKGSMGSVVSSQLGYFSSSKSHPKRFCNKRKISIFIEILFLLIALGLILEAIWVPNSVAQDFYDGVAKRIVMTRNKQSKNNTAYQEWEANVYEVK